jgi:hypothetical protein
MAITTKVVGTQLESEPLGDIPTGSEAAASAASEYSGVELKSDLSLLRGRLLMDYADSGDGKSTRAHSFARHYYRKTGKPVRLVSAEDSTRITFQDLIEVGIVQPLYITDTKTPLSTYERIMEGEWPTGKFEEVKGTKKEIWEKKSEWSGIVSAYIFEGLSTFSENMLDLLREQGRFPREQSDGFSEGGRTFMAASQTAYGFIQSEAIKLLKNSGMLPVERVLWTAHESKGKEEFGGGSTRGPKMVGSAGTDSIRKYVGVLLHSDRVGSEIRTYVENHPDSLNDKIQWKAKSTSMPLLAKEFKARFPKGYFTPTLPDKTYVGARDGLIPFLEAEEEIARISTDAAAQFMVASKR